MKGLLLKDLYMMTKYCRAYLLIVVVFIAVSIVGSNDLFPIFYACFLSGLIPVALISYDEKSKWAEYCETLPCKKSQLVSVKYLIGLFTQISVLMLLGIAQAIKMNIDGIFLLKNYLILMITVLIMCCTASSVTFPFIFKLGVEKGRIVYSVVVGLVCAGVGFVLSIFNINLYTSFSFGFTLPAICVAAIAVYALSWYLSIVFYKKREVK